MADKIKFFMDEHVPPAVTHGLQLRSVDVLTIQEVNRLNQDDDDLLRFATSQERVMFTQDADFLAHDKGVEHAGIAYTPQGTSIGDMVRGLLLIHDVLTPDEMRGRIEYL